MWRWLGKLLLHLVYVLVLGRMFATAFLTALFGLFMRAGMPLSPRSSSAHELWIAFLAGLLLGLLPRTAVLAGFGWITRSEHPAPARKWIDPQRWVWVLGSVVMLSGVGIWCSDRMNTSVLVPHPGISELIHHFFTESDLEPGSLRVENLRGYGDQVIFTGTWLCLLGYSLAALIPAGFFESLRRPTDPTDTLEVRTDSEEQGTDQNL
jgi:hypothetical protein